MSLTHTPAHTHEYPDRFVNEATGWGYSVRQDTDADDPRDNLPNVTALWAYSQPRIGGSVAGDLPEGNVAIDAFARYWDKYDAKTSLMITQRYLALFHSEKQISVIIKTIRGYSQSDWLDVVCSVENGYGTPESHIDEFRQWAFGDVWVVIPDGKPGISNIYADSAEDALKYFQENFEDFDPTLPTFERTLRLTITATDEDEVETKINALLSSIADSYATPTGMQATTKQKPIDPEWLDDIGDTLQTDHVDVSWRARDARGRIVFNSDISITPTQAAGMLRGIGEAQ